MKVSRCGTRVVIVALLLYSGSVIVSNVHQKGDDMSITKWHPFNDLEEMFEFRPMLKNHLFDMYEEENNIIVKMNVPGFDVDDINVKVEDHYLHISGEEKQKKEVKEKDYYHKEIKQGNFSRVVSLPCPVDEDAVTAELHNGVLTITMPRAMIEEKETKKIKVIRK